MNRVTKYWLVYEYSYMQDGQVVKRRIYTFDNEPDAWDLVEFLMHRDMTKPNLGVEQIEHEVTT